MIQAIIFDFDGVILDSLKVKDEGFRSLFSEFPADAVEKLMEYHHENGGVSRFVKIRYMFETILNKEIDEETVLKYASKFSEDMLKSLTDPKYLILDTATFIKKHYDDLPMHVASGTEEKELRKISKALLLYGYFKSIYGSPAEKNDVVKRIIDENGYNPAETIMIGDAMTDYHAAKASGLIFCGFNNDKLIPVSDYYITDFSKFAEHYGLQKC